MTKPPAQHIGVDSVVPYQPSGPIFHPLATEAVTESVPPSRTGPDRSPLTSPRSAGHAIA